MPSQFFFSLNQLLRFFCFFLIQQFAIQSNSIIQLFMLFRSPMFLLSLSSSSLSTLPKRMMIIIELPIGLIRCQNNWINDCDSLARLESALTFLDASATEKKKSSFWCNEDFDWCNAISSFWKSQNFDKQHLITVQMNSIIWQVQTVHGTC